MTHCFPPFCVVIGSAIETNSSRDQNVIIEKYDLILMHATVHSIHNTNVRKAMHHLENPPLKILSLGFELISS